MAAARSAAPRVRKNPETGEHEMEIEIDELGMTLSFQKVRTEEESREIASRWKYLAVQMEYANELKADKLMQKVMMTDANTMAWFVMNLVATEKQ
jgi:hypothetical protein